MIWLWIVLALLAGMVIGIGTLWLIFDLGMQELMKSIRSK